MALPCVTPIDVFVRTPFAHQVISFRISDTDTVSDLVLAVLRKYHIQENLSESLRVVCAGKQLKNDSVLRISGIEMGDTVSILGRIRGD